MTLELRDSTIVVLVGEIEKCRGKNRQRRRRHLRQSEVPNERMGTMVGGVGDSPGFPQGLVKECSNMFGRTL